MKHRKEEVILLEEFKCHMALFSDEEANKFPPAQGDGDHKIVLLENTLDHFTLDGKLPFDARKMLTYMITKGNYFLSICIGKF